MIMRCKHSDLLSQQFEKKYKKKHIGSRYLRNKLKKKKADHIIATITLQV